jgi:hypothetical protein
MRPPPTARPVWPCLVCGQPFPRRPQATPLLCRGCVAKQAQAVWRTVLAAPRVGQKRTKAARPSLLHTLRRHDTGARHEGTS